MRSIIKCLFLALSLFLSSCGGEGENPLKEEYYYLEESNKDWLTPDTPGAIFIMRDINGIASSFRMTGNNETLGKSWSTFLGINTLTTYTEECFQSYKSSYGMVLGISMRANSPPQGDNIIISLDQVGFSYDFDFETIYSLDTPFGYKNLLMTDKGYELHDDGKILSTVEILDSLPGSTATYEELLHFTLKDFADQWTDFTVTEIYLDKEAGLVKYVLASGISSERSP